MTDTTITTVNAVAPREKVLASTEMQLNALLYHHGVDVSSSPEIAEDTQSLAKAIMSEFERLAVGKQGERLIFCDPDMPVEFIEG